MKNPISVRFADLIAVLYTDESGIRDVPKLLDYVISFFISSYYFYNCTVMILDLLLCHEAFTKEKTQKRWKQTFCKMLSGMLTGNILTLSVGHLWRTGTVFCGKV